MSDIQIIPAAAGNSTSLSKEDLFSEANLRLKYLAIVGTALMQRSNDNHGQTDYFLAKDALAKFKEAILKLDLDQQTAKGIEELVVYLQNKIDKRLNANSEMGG